MLVCGIEIADNKGLTDFELVEYAKELKIENFRGVLMRDSLPLKPHNKECGIVNFNKSSQPGSHWVCYFKNGHQRIYFDSFGQVTPIEIQKYLKTQQELISHKQVIQRNTDIVQKVNTRVCGHLCLLVLTLLTRKHLSYQQVLNLLDDGYTRGDW